VATKDSSTGKKYMFPLPSSFMELRVYNIFIAKPVLVVAPLGLHRSLTQLFFPLFAGYSTDMWALGVITYVL
jgi:hypothetical protein